MRPCNVNVSHALSLTVIGLLAHLVSLLPNFGIIGCVSKSFDKVIALVEIFEHLHQHHQRMLRVVVINFIEPRIACVIRDFYGSEGDCSPASENVKKGMEVVALGNLLDFTHHPASHTGLAAVAADGHVASSHCKDPPKSKFEIFSEIHSIHRFLLATVLHNDVFLEALGSRLKYVLLVFQVVKCYIN